MIYYDRIGVSEGIGVNRTSESKECDICHYWYLIFNICHLVYNICHYWYLIFNICHLVFNICHYWYLIFNICHLVYNICHYYKIKGLSFNKCNGCHDLSMMFMNLSDIAILNIEGAGYCCIIIAELAKVRP